MLKKIVYRLLAHRHFWRHVGFDELSELYISSMLRSLSVSLSGLFIPLYMLQLGYSLVEILLVISWYFTARCLFGDILSAYTVARIGPKHTMLIGQCLLTISTAMFLVLGQIAWPVWLLGFVWGSSASFFFIAFDIDFSKVKHSIHGGKELGYINIMEKIGAALGPLVGGIVATVFGAQYVFLVATVLLIGGTIPLFRTAEPVKTRQKIHFSGLKLKNLKYDYLSVVGLGIENTLTAFLWPLYLGVFVLAGSAAYAKLGVLWSASIVTGIISAHLIGKLIDNRHGRKLLRYSAGINALLHLVRPLITTYPAAFGVNIVNDSVTVGYRMSYFKGLYDAADNLPGYRIVYLSSIELFSSIGKAIMWWSLVVLAMFLSTGSVFVFGFVIAAAASMLITTEHFKALNPRGI